MKKQILLSCLAFLVLFNCDVVDKLDELTKFEMDYQTTYSIPPVAIVNLPVSLSTPDIETDSETTFSNNKTNKNSVESIRLKSMVLNITAPENANFDFLKEIHIYIKSDNVEEVEIANSTDIENLNSSTLELDVLDKELEAYLKEEQFTLRVMAIADETTSQQIEVLIDTVFNVDAKILGL
ncbi:hypothetical protein [Flavisericum labens]|uniref:hypothetical protein n=1 Tax=Flavisericum labens TaxID=3377112 RepID=UPI00387B555A